MTRVLETSAVCIGPRIVGGRYHDGYWGNQYVVDAIYPTSDNPIGWSGWAITCHDVTEVNTGKPCIGPKRTHCTAWDSKRDRVISQASEELV